MSQRPIAVRVIDGRELLDCRAVEIAAFRCDPLITVPAHIRHTTNIEGGLTLGAFDRSRLVGFSYAIPSAADDGGPVLYSLGLAVLPEYWNAGIGRELKARQVVEATDRGFLAIRWTVVSLNARMLRVSLGHGDAELVGFRPDLYTGLVPGPGEDQVVCERPLGAHTTRPPRDGDDGQLVELPWATAGLTREVASRWRRAVRDAMETLLHDAYIGDDVVLDRPARRVFVRFRRRD